MQAAFHRSHALQCNGSGSRPGHAPHANPLGTHTADTPPNQPTGSGGRRHPWLGGPPAPAGRPRTPPRSPATGTHRLRDHPLPRRTRPTSHSPPEWSVRCRFHTCLPVYRGFARITATVRNIDTPPLRCRFRARAARGPVRRGLCHHQPVRVVRRAAPALGELERPPDGCRPAPADQHRGPPGRCGPGITSGRRQSSRSRVSSSSPPSPITARSQQPAPVRGFGQDAARTRTGSTRRSSRAGRRSAHGSR